MTITEFLEARISEDEALANAATPGPWGWWNLEGADQGWSDNGPNLESTQGEWKTCQYYCTWKDGDANHRGERGKQGHEHLATEQVVGSWGHDANGITVALADATHIAVHDPSRTLAECRAKRKMLDNIPKSSDIFDPLGGTSAYVLFCLAAVYASHPDYREEWKL